jgi:hypothetical protein
MSEDKGSARPCVVQIETQPRPLTATTIDLTEHAIERFRERVRPAIDFDAAADELAQIAARGELTAVAPAWLRARALVYLVLGDVVLPLEPDRREPDRLVAVTCLVRGSLSPRARAARNACRRRRPCFGRTA